jgi:tryptophan synthase beta chain
MHTLGHTFVPDAIHAGGLRYHGNAPLLSLVLDMGLIEPRALNQKACFEAALQFVRSECILPAPESSHAIRAAIDEALRCKAEGRSETIVFNLSGHGHFDLSAYENYLSGKMEDVPFDEAKLQAALSQCPEVDPNLCGGF